jgi:hypothetical protein
MNAVLQWSPRVGSPHLFEGPFWQGVARVVDRIDRLDVLREHRLQLIAAARRHELGQPVEDDLAVEARAAALAALAVPALLDRVRSTCSGRIVLFKGAEAAAAYPSPVLRPYVDLDVLVPDATRATRELLAAGFVRVGEDRDYAGEHHGRPLAHPDVPISLEVHSRPKWVSGLEALPAAIVFERTVAAAPGVDGVEAPEPAVHAVLLAAHAWAELRPLGRLGDLVDVSATAARGPEGEAGRIAHQVGLGRVWDATSAAADTLFLGRRRSWPLRTWARHLPQARERTVLDVHLMRLLSPFSTFGSRAAFGAAGASALHTLRPSDAESWSAKLARASSAVRDAGLARSEHESRLTDDGEEGK